MNWHLASACRILTGDGMVVVGWDSAWSIASGDGAGEVRYSTGLHNQGEHSITMLRVHGCKTCRLTLSGHSIRSITVASRRSTWGTALGSNKHCHYITLCSPIEVSLYAPYHNVILYLPGRNQVPVPLLVSYCDIHSPSSYCSKKNKFERLLVNAGGSSLGWAFRPLCDQI